MNNKRLIFFILFILFNNILLFANNQKNILVINSYHRGFQWSDDVIRGMEKVLYKTNININVLYMDSKRISSNDYYKELKDLYKVQFQNNKYDLILAIDKFAYDFVINNYSQLFTNEKILFTGMEQFDLKKVKKYNLENKVFGILEKRAISEISELILELLPNLKKLYIINDNSENGNDTDVFIQKTMQKINKRTNIEYIRSSTLKDLKLKFKEKKENEAVFFIRFYNDKYNKLNKNSKIAEMIEASPLPVFVTDSLFLNKGALGGKIISIEGIGEDTGIKILKILNETKNIKNIETYNKYKYIFDYDLVKRFDINLNNVKEEYNLINTPLSFIDKHKRIITSVFFIFPFLVFLLIGLLYNIYLRIKSTKQLKERMEFDKVLLNAIDSPIVCLDSKNNIIDSNAKFINFINFPCPKYEYHSLKDYLSKYNINDLINLLKENTNKSLENDVITLFGNDYEEYIFAIKKKKYVEQIYKSTGTVIIFLDVTKEKLALREKIKHQEFIIQQSKLAEIGEIFSSVAHQWKTPLVEIATIAQEQVYAKDGEVNEKESIYLNDTMVQVRYMTETINDFQNFIKPSKEKIVFNISDAVYKMMSIIEHNLKYNYINININISPSCKLLTYGYKNELMQTLLNIVNNAKDEILKIKKNQKNFNGEINIFIKNINKFVQIEIEDNAGGIKLEDITKVFDSDYSTKKEGHGIGLYMAKLIIEDKMNGILLVENTKKGAKFKIKLELSNENISS